MDATKIGCVGNSGGGTLTAYIAALDPRVSAVAIGCYITTLRRRMGNRIQQDPSANPEQDLFGFVSAGIDHAGLLAMIAPRPTLLGFARFDFFPIEGARAKRSTKPRGCMKSPAWVIASTGSKPPNDMACLSLAAPRRTNGLAAGCREAARRLPLPNSQSLPGLLRSCSFARTVRSAFLSDRGRSCRWLWNISMALKGRIGSRYEVF